MATQGYEQNYCQICKKLLPVDEFLLNNQGKRNKTCKRNSKKPPLQIDDWDEFIKLIRKWNRPDQHETLNASYTFSLDALPVRFGSYRIFENAVDSGSGSVGSKDSQRSQLNAAMADLAEIIWKEGGFRFKHTATTHQTLTFSYNCSQDAKFVDKYESKVAPEKRRDASRMLRFPCQSKLSMRPCFENRTLSLSIRHEWHEPYQSIRLSPEALALITSMVSTKTPAEIYREIQDFPEAENVTRHQVYYLWQRANAGLWQRDADPMKSATILLSEDDRYRDAYDCIPWMNVRALIFYSLEAIRKLAESITQLVMDATYGTNNGEFAPPPGSDIRDQIEAQVYLQGQGEESESEDEPSSGDDDDQKPLATRFSEFKEMIQEALALADDQFEKGSEKFVEKFMLSGEPYRVLLEEVKSRQRKRNGLKTWGRYRHPATMYLK
ncbi:hypothetical protein VTN31DRAFT_6009 [Thermomyces dupontii]|uniref:uncharacterized protein n=1 Tax=Talaromyces thermophilus TaxID=28565 RepID=UPI003743F767